MSHPFVKLLCLSLLALTLCACRSSPPLWPEVESGGWVTYTRADVGYTLEVPAAFAPEEIGKDTVFRYHGFPIFRVLLVGDAAARQRGLWVTSRPVATTNVAGGQAEQYIYDHQDFFTYTHTLAYVLPHGNSQLGIEFRSDADSLTATQQRVLDSFRFN